MIGCELRWGNCSGLVVETEAYRKANDEAAHMFFRRSARAFLAEHGEGTAYVYLNYGVHWLFNVLFRLPDCSDEGFVLVRALQPLAGLGRMRQRRGRENERDLCSGPGKLTQALGITGEKHHGLDLLSAKAGDKRGLYPRKELMRTAEHNPGILADVRIGISRSKDLPYRFLLRESQFLSVKPSAAAKKVVAD